MRDSARSLIVVFIACAPPVRELMGISAPTRLKSIAPGASRHLVAGGVSARGREWKIDGWRALAWPRQDLKFLPMRVIFSHEGFIESLKQLFD